jgi:GAF domain-containing protein/anti-sigma regulatory factor (Ser/Thr protein kinase)
MFGPFKWGHWDLPARQVGDRPTDVQTVPLDIRPRPEEADVRDASPASDGVVLPLPNEVDAASQARRAVLEFLASRGCEAVADDAVLAISELVTNAVLHAVPPVELRLVPVDRGVRAEVRDGSRIIPVRPLASTDTMTGRGIALVEAVSDRWGVEQRPDGKVVWCEVTASAGREEVTGEDVDIDALLASWEDDEAAEPTYTVHLGDVPTDLLIAAKAHVDNLVREFTLASSGEHSGNSGSVPEDLATLIDTVVHQFAQARHALKRQAIAAANRGESRTHLTVTLSLSAVEPGEAYLSALDLADSYARDARLLTLETPPQHRVFRHWYVDALVQQVRNAAAGLPVEQPPTFEQRLLDELGTVAAAQRTSARAARLQSVTALLASAATAEDVADVVVSAGVAVLAASGGGLLLGQDGSVAAEVPPESGRLVQQLQTDAPDVDLPGAAAIRTGSAVWLESRQARDVQFPTMAAFEPQTVALCAVPLQGTGRILGALRFGFDTPQLFDADERAFITALAAQTAQALERTELYEAERTARARAEDIAQRLARLQEVTAALSSAADVDAITQIVVQHASQGVGATLTTVCLLTDEDTLTVVKSHGLSDDTRERWLSFPVSAPLPASEAIRTNAPVLIRDRDEMERRYPQLAGQALHDRSLVCVPVSLGVRALGAISLSFPKMHEVDDTELRFLRAVADACAQALDRASALERSRVATERLAFLAYASSELGRTLDFRETLATLARLAVPRLADWASVEILEDGRLEALAVSHVDPAKVSFARELRERYPMDQTADSGVPQVVRSGVSEIYPVIPDEALAATAVDEEHLALIRSLQMRSVVIVPLTGREGTFGALTLIAAESGRTYDDAFLSFAEDVAARAAVAVENAQAYSQQSGRLAAITRVAEAAQHAILAPVPSRLGPVRLQASYNSAARDALVGGDMYEAIERDGTVRLLIGDVRGKGLEAVRMATVVLGHFRSAAVECADLGALARQVDARLQPYLGDEDFVTALIAEISPDGACAIVTCGHPPALLAENGRITAVGAADSLPLGLGADPSPVRVQLQPGARLLLYTDGILEARSPAGGFVPVGDVVGPLVDGTPLENVLDRILDQLRSLVGGSLGDDLALLVAELLPAS